MTFEKFERFLIIAFICFVYWIVLDILIYLKKKCKERNREKDD